MPPNASATSVLEYQSPTSPCHLSGRRASQRWMLGGAALLVFTAIAWVGSHWYEGDIELYVAESSIQFAVTRDVMFVQRHDFFPLFRMRAEFHPIPDLAPYDVDCLSFVPRWLGFGCQYEKLNAGINGKDTCVTGIVPFWFIALLGAAAIVFGWSKR